MRTEIYENDDSRVPSVKFGTPVEDAFRRDFTINSLFFNIQTRSIEDLTGRGLQDLRDGLLQTPLPATQTFQDDPFRMLRAIRFASRLNFTVNEDICECLSQNAPFLSTKVENARIGGEVDLYLLECPLALELLVTHRLCFDVFKPKINRVNWQSALEIFKEFLAIKKEVEQDQETRLKHYYAAFLLPLYSLDNEEIFHVLLDSLNRPKRIASDSFKICKYAVEFGLMLHSEIDESALRERIGQCIYSMRDFWEVALQIALVASIASRKFSRDAHSFCEAISHRFHQLVHLIRNVWVLDNVWNRKILNGHDLKVALKIQDPKLMARAVLLEQRYNCLHAPSHPDDDKKRAVDFVTREFYAYVFLDEIVPQEIDVDVDSYCFYYNNSDDDASLSHFFQQNVERVFLVAVRSSRNGGEMKQKIISPKHLCFKNSSSWKGLNGFYCCLTSCL